MKVQIAVRDYTRADFDFICNSWRSSFRGGAPFGELINKETYNFNQKKVIEELLKRSRCIVATSTEDSNQIFGFLVFDKNPEFYMLHYVYIKAPYRLFGIASYLKNWVFDNKSMPIISTCYTRKFPRLQERWKLEFNPYLLFDILGD